MTNTPSAGPQPVAAVDRQATAAMVLGILGLALGSLPVFIGLVLGFIPMALAIVLGIVSIVRAKRRGFRANRRAIAGFILGCLQFVLLFFGYGVLW